jgi:hypothetical protein
MSKVISFIKDPHIVSVELSTGNATMYSGYRVLIQDEDGGIYIRSLTDTDIDGTLNADNIINLDYKDCEVATKEVIRESIMTWRSRECDCGGGTLRETAEYVLTDFLRAKMIDMKMYNEILSEYE